MFIQFIDVNNTLLHNTKHLSEKSIYDTYTNLDLTGKCASNSGQNAKMKWHFTVLKKLPRIFWQDISDVTEYLVWKIS